MNRFNIFSQNTTTIINSIFELAEHIYGDCDFNTIRIGAGLPNYGKDKGAYHPHSKIIRISTNHIFNLLYMGDNGWQIENKSAFTGVLLHELGHHAEYYVPAPYQYKNAVFTHRTKSWCYICAIGWNYFHDIDLTPELLLHAIKYKPEVYDLLSSYEPNNLPDRLIPLINELPPIEKHCLVCQSIFIPIRVTAKYCSGKCRVANHRKNNLNK